MIVFPEYRNSALVQIRSEKLKISPGMFSSHFVGRFLKFTRGKGAVTPSNRFQFVFPAEVEASKKLITQ